MTENDQKRKKKVRGAITLLLVTWAILLLLLIFILILRLQGYDNFQEWRQAGRPSVTETPKLTASPAPTEEPGGTEAPSETPVPTETPTPTVTPTVTPTPIVRDEERLAQMEAAYGTTEKTYGTVSTESTREGTVSVFRAVPVGMSEVLDAAAKAAAERLLTEAKEQAAAEQAEAAELYLNYDSYRKEGFVSLVFHLTSVITREGGQEETTTVTAVTFLADTGEELTGSELFLESYFAILKERLMEALPERFPETAESAFFSYETPYRAADYQQYYIKEDKVVFLFGENTLSGAEHPAFTYETDLTEALAFMHYDLTGTKQKAVIRELDPNTKMIALTFDDGPYPPVDKKILESLLAHNGRATFFSVADRVKGSYVTMLQELYAAGNEIASHTYSHKYFNKMKGNTLYSTIWPEVNQANLIIAKAVGRAPAYVRMPGGAKVDYMKNMPFPMVNWSVSSEDWSNRDKDVTFANVTKNLRDGDIVLMHSLYPSTAEATEMILDYMEENGFLCVTLSELFYYKNKTIENGTTYTSGR